MGGGTPGKHVSEGVFDKVDVLIFSPKNSLFYVFAVFVQSRPLLNVRDYLTKFAF